MGSTMVWTSQETISGFYLRSCIFSIYEIQVIVAKINEIFGGHGEDLLKY
jgi:hypothetical protein